MAKNIFHRQGMSTYEEHVGGRKHTTYPEVTQKAEGPIGSTKNVAVELLTETSLGPIPKVSESEGVGQRERF